MKRVFFSAGEASGDAYAARLATGLRAKGDLLVEGVGGRRLAGTGVNLVADSSRWGALGILESLKVAPLGLLGFWRAKAVLRQGEPGLLVPIDFGYFNLRLARHARRWGWKVLYFIPPSSWRRDRQGADIPAVSDLVVTPFPWSAALLREAGCDARWLGHPLRQLVRENQTVSAKREAVAVLPGSRAHEIKHNLPVIAQALKGLGRTVVFAVAPTVTPDYLLSEWHKLGGGEAICVPSAAAAFSQARAGVVCSGTATLEGVLCGCPMVVVYQGSRAMKVEAWIRRPKIRWIGLPNILLDRTVVPELILSDATADAVRRELTPLLADSEAREAQLSAFREIEEVLGGESAIDQAVGIAWDLLHGTRNAT